ncbi:facilitated trehalose transporter Tret1 isoform X2 [Manduca sexta]|uniref:facilitated trehalose transporter Tret1 isoform X2 n=1 Tax=Manduca sexta TaxID=7130 RepID=UPI00188E5C92|nr:facilitated trehalose transporter Tret1 isoform X2 [Manduca sexta]
MDSPFLRQLFIASSPQLAAFSVGGVSGFSNVILEQLRANDSSIPIDFEIATWIGSTHGLAGIPSIAMPTIMQWRGRKFSYIISCLLIITGWLLTYLAQNVMMIIIGECFHGLGNNSIVIVSLCTISEMVDPRYRAISLSFYTINQTLGITICGVMGRYLHWKTVSIIMSIPITVALLMSCVWPESPSWLAYKGKYAKCEKTFKWLRGFDEDSRKELKELMSAQKEYSISEGKAKFVLKDLWFQITSKDFYVPCFHTFVVLSAFYFSGLLVVLVYGVDIIQTVTNSALTARYGIISIHIFSYIGALSTALHLKLFKNKTVFLATGVTSSLLMFGASVVILLQSVGILSNNSTISVYFLVGFMFFLSAGVSSLSFGVPNELMPVKHRGLGGAVYIIMCCILHTSILKLSPYLILYIGLWGTFMMFSLIEMSSIIYIWRYIPETKGRTLQEIEDFYNDGYFVTSIVDDVECLNKNKNKL